MADKRMSIVFDASMNIAQVKSAVGEIQKALSGVTMPQNISNSFSKTIDSLTKEIANFEQRASKGLETASDFSGLAKSGQKIVSLYDDLQASMRRLGAVSDKELAKLFPPELVKDIEAAGRALSDYEATVKQSRKDIDAQTAAIASQEKELGKLRDKLDSIKNKNVVSPADFTQLKNDLKAAEQELSDYQNKLTTVEQEAQNLAATLRAPAKSSKYRALVKEADGLRQSVESARAKVEQLNNTVNNTTTFAKQSTAINKTTQDITEAETKLQDMITVLNQLQAKGDTDALTNLRSALEKIQTIDLSQFPNTIDGMRQAIASLDAKGLEQLRQNFAQLNQTVQNGAPVIQDFSNRNKEAAASVEEFNRKSREVDGLKSRIQYFFGITNAINLFRRAVTSALDTVKELDKAMTETAVVTDFSVGDMWDKLPEYTKVANELGTTTLGAYETMTLFYQQGLKTNEVFEIGTETMKMARIAGMDYAEATNMMTAALRGFNMELSDTSAQRVNDVYSKLAAITASDTQEISTAMTKTASIANSANMEFETTAAFLSQIIETTRESAETAGTAMKTVIARFQELKKDPAEIELVDGEEVNANKIEAALKTIGVALRDTTGQFRDLDDVFLDIAQRWDSLSTNQQRYIATMAAGSRQQSRFIAMMGDYDRTVQLINAANNSAGASQAQFEKTTESLESKLNKLKNAWDAYTMGLANSSVIKSVVDLLTQLITAINKITDALPGPTKGLGKLAIAMLGLKAGAAIFDSYFVNLKKMGTPVKALGATFTQTFGKILSTLAKAKNLVTKDFWLGKANTDPTQINNITTALNNLTKAKERVSNQPLNISGAMRNDALAMERIALDSYNEALAAAGVTEAEFSAIQAAGIPVEAQAALLHDEVAMAKFREIMATEGLTEEERKEQIQQLASNAQTKMGILLRLKNVAALLFGTQGARAAAMANLGLAASEEAAAAATGGLTAALYTLPIGWIMVAVVALAAAFYLLWKAMDEARPEKQLERAEEAAANAAEAATKAQESFDDLKASLDELGDSYSNLQQLTQGTKDWTEAVVATNNQVLDLIGNYKELAQYVKNTDGVLTLDVKSDEVQGVIKDYENRAALARSAEAISNINVEQKQRNVDYANLDNGAKVNQITYYKREYYDDGGSYNQVISRQEYAANSANNDAYSQGTGTSRELTEALAKAIAEGKVRDTGDGMATAIETWLRGQDLNGEVTDTQYQTWAANLAESSDLLREFGNSLIASTAAEDTYRDSIVNNARDYGDISSLTHGDLINQISNEAFTGNLDDAIAAEKAAIMNKADKNGLATEDLNEFVKISGGKYKVKGQKIVDAESGEEVEGLTNEAIAQQLAAARATEQLAGQMTNLNEVFQSIDMTAGVGKSEELAALMSKEGSELSRQMINTYAEIFNADNLDAIDWDAFAKSFGFDSMTTMAENFGMTVEDMTDLIGKNFATASDALNKQRAKIVGSIKKANKSVNKSYETIAQELKDLENKFDQVGIDFYGVFNNVSNALARAGSEQVSDLGLQQFWDAANNLTPANAAQIKELEAFVNDINWSNPIEAMYDLNQEMRTGTGLTKDYATKMSQLGKSAYDAAHQMSYMLMSSDFEDVQEDLDEILATNGKIAASDVYDLASSYKTLNKFMKNTGVTANGVARALTLVGQGKIGINQLTNSVLAAISQFESLDGIVAKVLKTFEDFDPGADENDIAGFFKDAYDTLNENLEKSAVGNNQNFSYLDLLLGPQWRQKTDEDGNILDMKGDELVTRMRQVTEQLRRNSEDMRASWTDLAAGKDFYGNEAGSLGNLSIVDTGKKITLEGFEGMTTADIVKQIQDAYHVTETYAEAMLGDFKNYSADLAAELRDNDVEAAIQAMYDNANLGLRATGNGSNWRSFVGVRLIDESEIRAVAEALGKSYDDIKKELEEKGALITNFYDEDGMIKSTSEVVKEMKRVLLDDSAQDSALWFSRFLKGTEIKDGINILNFKSMQDTLNRLNIPEDKWLEVGNALVAEVQRGLSAGQTVEVEYQLSDGSYTNLSITPEIDLATAINNAETELQNAKLGEAIAAAFGDVTISTGVDENSLSEAQTKIETTIAGEAYEITVTTTPENLQTVTDAVVNAVQAEKPDVNFNARTDQITTAIRNLNLTKEVKLTYTVTNSNLLSPSTSTVTIPGHASGIKGALKAHDALVAEEGPELIQTQDGAYIAENPQITRIGKGDTVYTADETKQILRGNRISGEIPRYGTGKANGYNADWWYDKEGGGDGTFNNNTINSNNVTVNDSAVDDEPDLWENPYDWLYNLTEKINENLRERNNLEKKFQILQKRGRTSAEITAKYYDKQFELLKQNYDLEEEMYQKRTYEMKKLLAENPDMQKYGTFDFENMRIVIDWNLIDTFDKTENVEEGERIEDYISELERIQELIEDAEEAMLDAALATEELKDQLRDYYLELEDRVAAALEQIDRDEVAELERVYDAITSADEDLLTAMKEQISEYRQARDNRETEEDIAKKERRLAYMRQDTSGGNKTDILKLEDEIEKARQQYQDKLVDQALANLQTQQDYAAEQRDKQITLMESQIDWNVKNGVYVAQVAGLLEAAFRDDHFLTQDDALYQILYDGEGWGSKSVTALGKIIEEINALAQAAFYAQQNTSNEDKDTSVYNPNIDYMAEMRRAFAAAGGQMTDEVIKLNTFRNQKIADNPELAAKYPQLSVSQAERELLTWWNNGGKNTYQSTGINSAGNDLLGKPSSTTTTGTGTGTPTTTTPTIPTTTQPAQTSGFAVGSYVKVSSGAKFTSGATFSEAVRKAGVIDGKPGAFKILRDGGNGNYYIGRSWTSTGVTGLINKKWLTAYAKGGLADFTGPAWLDGTPSKPEVVLNAKDSANFFQLRDILRESLDGATSIQHGGDTYQYDIDVNNPQIASDYDVDEMIRRVEDDVYAKSMYRNTNAVKRLR